MKRKHLYAIASTLVLVSIIGIYSSYRDASASIVEYGDLVEEVQIETSRHVYVTTVSEQHMYSFPCWINSLADTVFDQGDHVIIYVPNLAVKQYVARFVLPRSTIVQRDGGVSPLNTIRVTTEALLKGESVKALVYLDVDWVFQPESLLRRCPLDTMACFSNTTDTTSPNIFALRFQKRDHIRQWLDRWDAMGALSMSTFDASLQNLSFNFRLLHSSFLPSLMRRMDTYTCIAQQTPANTSKLFIPEKNLLTTRQGRLRAVLYAALHRHTLVLPHFLHLEAFFALLDGRVCTKDHLDHDTLALPSPLVSISIEKVAASQEVRSIASMKELVAQSYTVVPRTRVPISCSNCWLETAGLEYFGQVSWMSDPIGTLVYDAVTEAAWTTRYDTCALVGSSGRLLGAELGPQIGMHDAVFRMNHAEVLPHLYNDVGDRTDVRLVNFLVLYMDHIAESRSIIRWGPEDKIKKLQEEARSDRIQKDIGYYVMAPSAQQENDAEFFRLFRRDRGKTRANLSTAWFMLYAMLHMCSDITVYGLGIPSGRAQQDCQYPEFQKVKYHYTDYLSRGSLFECDHYKQNLAHKLADEKSAVFDKWAAIAPIRFVEALSDKLRLVRRSHEK